MVYDVVFTSAKRDCPGVVSEKPENGYARTGCNEPSDSGSRFRPVGRLEVDCGLAVGRDAAQRDDLAQTVRRVQAPTCPGETVGSGRRRRLATVGQGGRRRQLDRPRHSLGLSARCRRMSWAYAPTSTSSCNSATFVGRFRLAIAVIAAVRLVPRLVGRNLAVVHFDSRPALHADRLDVHLARGNSMRNELGIASFRCAAEIAVSGQADLQAPAAPG